MSIRTELSQKRREAIEQQAKLEQELEQRLEPEARKFIEEIIIPHFRLMAERYPTQDTLIIGLYSNDGESYSELTSPLFDNEPIQCNGNIARIASKLASEYDITSNLNFLDSFKVIDFYLVLD